MRNAEHAAHESHPPETPYLLILAREFAVSWEHTIRQTGTGQSLTLTRTQKIGVYLEIADDLRQTPLTARRETNCLNC